MNKTVIDNLVKLVTEQTKYKLPAFPDELMTLPSVGQKAIQVLHDLGYVRQRDIPFSDLTVRAGSALYDLGIKNKNEARAMIESGRLAPGKRRNYGDKTHREVCAWVGIKLPAKTKKKIRACPHCGKRI